MGGIEESLFPGSSETGTKRKWLTTSKASTPDSDDDLLLRSEKRRKRVRICALAVALIFGILLVKALTRQPVTEVVQSIEIPAEVTADTAAASSVAEIVARNYLTLDEKDGREKRLDMVWNSPGSGGWNGKGASEVHGDVFTVAAKPLSETEIDVTVAVLSSYEGTDPMWTGVLVPMQVREGYASVRDIPRIVGLPQPAEIVPVSADSFDNELTSLSAESVSQFFHAWSTGDATAVVAPGATIPEPPAGWGSAELKRWKVIAGEGDRRTGYATVTWTLGEATLDTSYTVDISEVRAGGSTRWQVANIR